MTTNLQKNEVVSLKPPYCFSKLSDAKFKFFADRIQDSTSDDTNFSSVRQLLNYSRLFE